MDIWSSIRDFCSRWKAELLLYGIGFLLLGSALATGKGLAAGLVFLILILWDVARRWGEPWRQLGEAEFRRRQQASRDYWQQRAQAFFARLRGGNPDHDGDTAGQAAAATRLIRQPHAQSQPKHARHLADDPEDEPPESPGGIQESPPPPPAPPAAPVTHDT